MIIIDTSAWIEYLNNGDPQVVSAVDNSLSHELVGIGDLIYCEIIQGIKSARLRRDVSALLLSLPQYNMVGFDIAERSADNYRLLRSKGITVRKTIDVLIGTFCIERKFSLIHRDKDFDSMEEYLGLKVLR